jgi:AcrR family transcriptional regulator
VIREASLRILRTEGADALTTNRIAEVAGVSIGSLYHHYRDKHAVAADICDALLLAELDKLDDYTRQALAIGRVSLGETLHFFIREIVERHRTLYRQLGQYYLEIHARYDLERWMARHHPQRMLTAEWLPDVFARHATELGVQDFALAATMVVNAIHGTLHATLDATPALLLEDRFVDELHALVMRYLRKG